MSAICAVFRFDGIPVPTATVGLLLDGLSEYGTEAASWVPGNDSAPVALGCRPWRITPEDAFYRAPERSSDGRIALVADARIDNRSELSSALGISVDRAATLSDAGFILSAYQAWGADCPRHLLGDFTFVLWDGDRRTLFSARDGVGQRVLFFHRSPAQLALATTAHALTRLPEVGARLNRQKVADFLVLLQDPETTFFEGIRRLRPGSTMTATADGVRIERFWSAARTRPIVLGSDREYVEGFLQVFGDAVRARVRSAGPIGIMLSGGLDSSSVAAMASRQLQTEGLRLKAYHAAPRPGFQGAQRKGWTGDESAEVRAIAAMHPNLDLRIRPNNGSTLFDQVETLFRMTGAPPRNPTNLGWFAGIYGEAKEEGVRVLLAGHKGNATISYTGLRSIGDAARRGRLAHVWREVGALARATGQGRRSVFKTQVLAPLTPHVVASWIQRGRPASGASLLESTASAVNPAFARAMQLENRVQAARRDQQNMTRMSELEFRVAVLESAADVLDIYSGLRPWFGIETRDPTCDLRVVEYCFAIPGSQYLRNGVNRWLIRRAMEGQLPDQVRNRTTIGAQNSDWSEWLPALRETFLAELDRLDRSETANQCLDLARLRSLVERWPDRLGLEHEKEYHLLLPRGIMMGRFIRWFEETYQS